MHLLLFRPLRAQRWKVIKGRRDSIIRNKTTHILSYLLLASSFFRRLLHRSEKPKISVLLFLGQALAFWQSIVGSFTSVFLCQITQLPVEILSSYAHGFNAEEMNLELLLLHVHVNDWQ